MHTESRTPTRPVMFRSRVLHPRRCVRPPVRLVPGVQTVKSRPGSAIPDLHEDERALWGAHARQTANGWPERERVHAHVTARAPEMKLLYQRFSCAERAAQLAPKVALDLGPPRARPLLQRVEPRGVGLQG